MGFIGGLGVGGISANLIIKYKAFHLAHAFSLAFSKQTADLGAGFDELGREQRLSEDCEHRITGLKELPPTGAMETRR